MDEKKYLKILKKQKNDIEYISEIAGTNSVDLDETIKDAESLLLNLGYKLPSNIENNLNIEKKKKLHLRDWAEIEVEANFIKKDISFKDLLSDKEIEKVFSKIKLLENEYENMNEIKCDKYDYLIAGISGVLTGLIDVFFVETPGNGAFGKWTDSKSEDFVKKIAKQLGWDEEKAKKKMQEKLGDMSQEVNPINSAIGFLEKNFKVNYDQQHGKLINEVFKMSPSNHHLKSLAHSPSPLGLIFSLLNQFTGTSSFIDKGKIITIEEKFELKGSNMISKIFCGIANWIMHIISDMSGSSGSKGRGSGVPIPFYELFQWLNIGKVGQHQKTIADISVLVFEQGYDLRHGMAMSIPVLMNELIVRFLWALKLYFKDGKTIKEILELRKSKVLKRMLFSAHGCFCLIDLGDAFVRNAVNPEPVSKLVGMLTRMNLIAWVRFGKLGFDEIKILLSKEYEKQKYVNEKLNDEWLLFVEDMSKLYEFI